MSYWCSWTSVSPEEANELLSHRQSDSDDDEDWYPEECLDMLSELLGQEENLARHESIWLDRAWITIHRCLTDDVESADDFRFDAGTYPLKLCVVGGELLVNTGSRSAMAVLPKDVPVVAQALAGITEQWMRDKFFKLPDSVIQDDDFTFVMSNFEEIRQFFQRAAAMGQALIVVQQ